MNKLRYLLAILLPWFMLVACASTKSVTLPLPPQYCKPASDLAKPKYLKRLPEVHTGNQDLYYLFLDERTDHAVDVRDFNSLLRTCVDPKLPQRFPVFKE